MLPFKMAAIIKPTDIVHYNKLQFGFGEYNDIKLVQLIYDDLKSQGTRLLDFRKGGCGLVWISIGEAKLHLDIEKYTKEPPTFTVNMSRADTLKLEASCYDDANGEKTCCCGSLINIEVPLVGAPVAEYFNIDEPKRIDIETKKKEDDNILQCKPAEYHHYWTEALSYAASWNFKSPAIIKHMAEVIPHRDVRTLSLKGMDWCFGFGFPRRHCSDH